MKGDLYFKNVPDTGSLFMEQVLFSYENIPIVFVCTNNNDLRYLCVCDDIIEEESWIIVKITNLKLLEILDDKSTVLSAFVGKTIVLATSDLNHHMQYNVIEYNDIDRDELPLCDQYLEMKDPLKSYIEKKQRRFHQRL